MDKPAIFAVIVSLALIHGCCSSTALQGPAYSSSSCPYGTYGESCTRICDATGMGGNCWAQCMDGVRSENLGDATTCCHETLQMSCQRMCDEMAQRIGTQDEMADCLEECSGTYASVGVPMDVCYIPL